MTRCLNKGNISYVENTHSSTYSYLGGLMGRGAAWNSLAAGPLLKKDFNGWRDLLGINRKKEKNIQPQNYTKFLIHGPVLRVFLVFLSFWALIVTVQRLQLTQSRTPISRKAAKPRSVFNITR